MIYEVQMYREANEWEEAGVATLDNMAEAGSPIVDTVHDALDNKAAFFGSFAVGMYDMARAQEGLAAPDEDRSLVARRGVVLAGVFELADNVIDLPGQNRSESVVRPFIERTRAALVEYADPQTVEELQGSDLQIATYALARHAHRQLDLSRPERVEAMDEVALDIQEFGLEQLHAKEPAALLSIIQNITGKYTEALTLPGEFSSYNTDPAIRKAAWHLGAMSGVLDHGSELAEDLREGANTFATTYLRQHGISRATLNEVATMRRDAASDNYAGGLSELEQPGQKAVYRGIARLISYRYAVKRFMEPTSPRQLSKIMGEAETFES